MNDPAAPSDEHLDDRWFVGRADVIAPVLQSLDARAAHGLAPVGTWGIGKTTVLEWIRRQATGKAVVLGPVKISTYIEALTFDPAEAEIQAQQGGGSRRSRQKIDTWEQYLLLLEHLIGARFGALRQAIVEARYAVAASASGPIEQTMTASGQLFDDVPAGSPASQDALAASVNHEVALLRDRFREAIEAAGSNHGAVVLVDEFDRLEGHVLHEWVVELVRDLRHTVVVLASRRSEPPGPIVGPTHLPSFTHDHVRAFLEARLGSIRDEAQVSQVLEFSRGLPQAVAMAADLIEQRRAAGSPEDLTDIEFDPSIPVTTSLLGTIVKELPSADLRLLLKEGRLARRIDLDIAHYLLFEKMPRDGSRDENERAEQAWSDLRDHYSLLENIDASTTRGLAPWRFHRYLSRDSVSAEDPTLRVHAESVHQKLARYYEKRLEEYDESRADLSLYRQWYKHEQPEWQALTLEWLHHAGRLSGGTDRDAARFELARVFLDTFWWWGCYVREPFCERVLDDWDRTQPASDREVSRLLRVILEAYPTGHRKHDRGNWAAVGNAITQLRDVLGIESHLSPTLAPNSTELDVKRAQRRWYVRAFTSLFRAHAFQFTPGTAVMAIGAYEDALAYLRAADDREAQAWTTFEFAELRYELGDPGGALDGISRAAWLMAPDGEDGKDGEDGNGDRIEPDPDLELLANLHRLHGDVLARDPRSWREAIDATARAVLRAYAFTNESTHPPDDYTVTFYQEHRERAAERLLSIKRLLDEPEPARRAAERFAAQLEELHSVDVEVVVGILERPSEDGDGARLTADLANALTPPPPEPGFAAWSDPAFVTRWYRVSRRVKSDTADADLRNLG